MIINICTIQFFSDKKQKSFYSYVHLFTNIVPLSEGRDGVPAASSE